MTDTEQRLNELENRIETLEEAVGYDEPSAVSGRIGSLMDRVEALESARGDRTSEHDVGDIVTLVISELPGEERQDPLAYLNGKVTFVTYPGQKSPVAAEAVRAKLSDVKDSYNRAVMVERIE